MRALIRRLSEENRLWGTERVRGERRTLRTLGINVGNGSGRRSRWRPAPRPPSQTGGTFLHAHAHAIWAAVADEEQHVHGTERERVHREQIGGPDGVSVGV